MLPGMETIPGQLGDPGREARSTPSPKRDAAGLGAPLKPNQVSETSLYGVPIVSLFIDGRERLCLAQISNTLLKNYSYNEIHNRRVALGITCVQCTPVQLELLRRAGAMPISSRRCGMITKREAERLCKSFLGAHSPPKLPENFAFDVSHECAWGCRGSFIPARYNSSRAKCIKCTFCSMYFSPNKFIFHSHRSPDSKYLQPDAANFNSWRRHLKLTEKKPSDDINHAWEDVKAMFNGGSRKRTLPAGGSRERSPTEARASSALGRSASPDIPRKTLRCDDALRAAPSITLAASARSYPLIPVPSKNFGLLPKIPPPLFSHHPYGFAGYGLCPKKSDGMPDATKTNVPAVFWPATKDAIYPAFPVFWPAASSLPVPPYPASPPGVLQDLDLSDQSERSANPPKDGQQQQHGATQPCPTSASKCRNDDDRGGDETPLPRKIGHISAFKPVVKDAETIAKLYGTREGFGVRPGYLSPDFVCETSSFRSVSPDRDTVDDGGDDDDDPDVDVESNRGEEEEEAIRISSRGATRESPVPEAAEQKPAASAEDSSDEGSLTRDASPFSHVDAHEKDNQVHVKHTLEASGSPSSANGAHDDHRNTTDKQNHRQADETLRIDISVQERNLEKMAKEELQKQLVEQMELRKKLEREFQHLKDNFHDQMKRELSYREEMVQQLQIVREAHGALHHFSCKMLSPRQCSGACTFKSPLLPP
ncbi:SKI family transcriptional corepressor 1 homolog-B-like [Syngnathoides biaculeatus]|uniref:SKI family transcriptional corepressor 1 homolog-B-like n=1 Tax=Syngnathoides biaculeatus TaxID=300417 RepID=UPI002ADD934A|nr:SKI family transcriptional corepressor 1 homolog-B-like [Syngnathoides biaculeatus]